MRLQVELLKEKKLCNLIQNLLRLVKTEEGLSNRISGNLKTFFLLCGNFIVLVVLEWTISVCCEASWGNP